MNKIKNWLHGFTKYQPLLRELVKRDIKVRYRHSVLGMLWTVLNPLLNMLVMTFIFSSMFKMSVDNFALYVMIGNIIYSFTAESTSAGMNSIVWNASLIKKVYIPKYLFPLSNILSCLVNFVFSFAAMLIVMLFTGAKFHPVMITVWIPLLYLMIFCCGLALFLCAINVFFRDIRHLYGVFLSIWMYMSAVFYSVDFMPPEIIQIIEMNPLYQYISFFRSIIMYGIFPGIEQNLFCIVWSLSSFIVGSVFFYKLQNKFILHI